MTFLAPLLFWLGLLALPVIALYLIKQQLRLKPVSTVLFWHQLKPAVHSTPLWRKLRRWFSLLLQLLVLALLIFALSRPLFSWQGDSSSALVLVVDPSVSMTASAQGKEVAKLAEAEELPTQEERLVQAAAESERWAEALRQAERRVASIGAVDEATIVVASDPPSILTPWTSNRRELREALQQLQPQAGPTDIRPAIALAKNLAVGRESAAVELITDGVWASEPEKEELEGVAIRQVEVEETTPNSGITLFSARRSQGSPGEYQLAAMIENNQKGEEALRGQLELYRNGGIMDVLEVEVPPGEAWRKEWRANDSGEALFEARFVPASPDALAMDNAATSRLAALRPVDVVLVSSGYPFLEAALNAQSLVSWQKVWPPERVVGEDAVGGAETLYIFHGAAPPEGFAGRAVLLVNPDGSGFWGERTGLIETPLISGTDSRAEPMRFVDMSLVRFVEAGKYAPPAGAEVMAESFGEPLIFGRWDRPDRSNEGPPRWLVLGFPLEKSDFVFRTAFPIFLGNLVAGLREQAMLSAGTLPGPVETQLAVTADPKMLEELAAPPLPAWTVGGLPLWWWFAFGGLALLLAEWLTYARRMTE